MIEPVMCEQEFCSMGMINSKKLFELSMTFEFQESLGISLLLKYDHFKVLVNFNVGKTGSMRQREFAQSEETLKCVNVVIV
jgi:hypothetical protein